LSLYYDETHRVTFGEKDSWNDWHLIPTSRPFIAPPNVNTKYIDVPGRSGQLDFTEVLAGKPTYQDRIGSFEFIIAPGYSSWEQLYSEIMAYLHGKRMRMVLSDDPEYYYEGRFSVNALKSSKAYSTITIAYQVGPFKYSIADPSAEGVL